MSPAAWHVPISDCGDSRSPVHENKLNCKNKAGLEVVPKFRVENTCDTASGFGFIFLNGGDTQSCKYPHGK